MTGNGKRVDLFVSNIFCIRAVTIIAIFVDIIRHQDACFQHMNDLKKSAYDSYDMNFTLSKKIRAMSLPPNENFPSNMRSFQELEHWGGKLYRTGIASHFDFAHSADMSRTRRRTLYLSQYQTL